MSKGFKIYRKKVIVVDFAKREVVESFEGLLQQNPETLEVMASEFLGEESIDAQKGFGVHDPYDDELATHHQGCKGWERWGLLDE